MTDNYRGRHKHSYKNNSNNRGRYRKHGNKNNIYSYPKDYVQYDHVEDERVSFEHLDRNLENVDDSINMESWRSSNTVKKYFGLGYSKQQQCKSSTVDKQFNTLSLKEQQQQGSINNINDNDNDNDNNNDDSKNNSNVINALENQEEDEDVGFYFDSTPTPVNNNTQNPPSILSTMFVKGKDLDKPDITTANNTDSHNNTSIKDDGTIYMNDKGHNNNKKKDRHKQKGRKILKGDDIYISSSSDDEDQVHISDRNNDKIMLEDNQEQKDDDDDYEEACADYIKNTDPDTWKQFELMANTRPVDDQLDGRIDDYDDDHLNELDQDDGENDNEDDDDDNDMVDFGLGDSDEEVGNQFNSQLSYQQQYSNNPYASPHLHAGMHNGYMTYYPPNYMPSFPSSHPPPQSPAHFHPPPNHFDPNYPPPFPPPSPHIQQQSYPLAIYSQNHYSNHNSNSSNKNDISYQLRRVDRRLQAFIMDSSRDTYQLPGMSDYCRRLVQGLATQYRLKLTPEILSNGKIGPLLRKSPRTCLPEDRKAIERHISKKRSLHHAKKINKKSKDGKGKGKNGGLQQQQVSSKPKGKIVGQHAAPLASNNIGHKMMAAMGWKEGESLGSNKDGILGPIEVRIRTKRRGLGH
ncbi:hypothetical protein BJ944DRAFT_261409 [Cunninghamella echinulata]|nr:hypothetical protein BJ944DRAFT_261409 [Cunninghamella echinulata]